MKATQSKIDSFWARVERGAGCWNWTAAKDEKTGRGRLRWDGTTRLAYRIAWELTNGPIPAGLFVCHRCDNPSCCNPEHLFLGEPIDNVRDMWSKGRASAPPHSYGDRHHMVRIPDNIVRQVHRDYESGMKLVDVAAKHGIAYGTVWRWATGRTRPAS